MSTESLNDLVNEAILAWTRITKTDPSRTSFRISLSDDGFSDLELRDIFQDLNESRDLDPTGLTTFMLLRGLMEEYNRSLSFSAFDIITRWGRVSAQVEPLRELVTLLECPHVVALIDEFCEWLKQASKHYGFVNTDGLSSVLSKKSLLAYLRRDALRSLKKLETHQFMRGTHDDEPLKFNPDILEFWNMNSLVRAMNAQRHSGVSLCLIRDPEIALFSFFCFAVKNGENIIILTDRPKGPHPDFKRMTRKPDRHLVRRMGQHWFPYELLELRVDQEQKQMWVKESSDLVPVNTQGVKIASVKNMEPRSFVWVELMFELLRDRFWERKVQAEDLSYTSDMMENPYVLAAASGSIVRSGEYTPLIVDPLKHEDVSGEAPAKAWGWEPVGENHWMVERYQSQVPESVYNQMGHSPMCLNASNGEIVPVSADGKQARGMVEIRTMDTMSFGTREHLEKERLWFARKNQIQVIKHLVENDFRQTLGELQGWYKERVRSNLDFLMEAVTSGTLVLPAVQAIPWPKDEDLYFNFGLNIVKREAEAVSQQVSRVTGRFSRNVSWDFIGMKGDSIHVTEKCGAFVSGGVKDDVFCFDEPTKKASVFTVFTPRSSEAIATLAGVSPEDLPWQIQHWSPVRQYTGNSILDSLDPEDWLLENPWDSLTFEVVICLCRHSMNARTKALGLPRKEWDKLLEPEGSRW